MKINSIIDLVKDLDTSRQTKNLNKLLIRILLHLQVEFSKVEEVSEEKPTEKVLETSKSDEDSTRLLRARDNEWKSAVKEVVSEAFTESKISLDNSKDKDEPLKLLKKAINALSSINHETIKSAENKMELSERIQEITDLIEEIKTDI